MKLRQSVFDTYWYYAAERQNIFFKRLHGEFPPYSNDPIFQKYKFCNAYRASDRVSQFLIKEVIYKNIDRHPEPPRHSDTESGPRSEGSHPERFRVKPGMTKEDSSLSLRMTSTVNPKLDPTSRATRLDLQQSCNTLFRIFLFRLLNKLETWQELEKRVGEISLSTFNVKHYSKVFEDMYAEGLVVYGNAFILCATKAFGFDRKHDNHLALLDQVFNNKRCHSEPQVKNLLQRKILRVAQDDKHIIVDRLLASKSLHDLFLTLEELPLIGDFMAYQIAIDMNYSEVFDFDENDFTVAGPGAKRGIAKCFEDVMGKSSEYIIQWMVENQDKEFERLGLEFKSLWGRKLHAIDCQNIFCETDKYSRVKFPELTSNRTRIKATFSENTGKIDYFYPPKWGIGVVARSK